MDPAIRFLNADDFPGVYATFCQAFADYPLDVGSGVSEKLRKRLNKNGVRWDCSVAVEVDGVIVGFTMIAVDDCHGVASAYEAITGIVPDYRGQGLAGQMFEKAAKRLSERGVKQVFLEVLQENERAIHAYQRMGFKKTREFICYQRTLNGHEFPPDPPEGIILRQVPDLQIESLLNTNEYNPSWENSLAGLERARDDCTFWGAFDHDTCVGAAVYCRFLEWVILLAVKPEYRRRGFGRALMQQSFSSLPKGTRLRVNNIESEEIGQARRREAITNLLAGMGLETYTRQFEMRRSL